MSMNDLARCYSALNRHADALKLYEEALAAHKRVLPASHGNTLIAMYNLALEYERLERYADALALLDTVFVYANRAGVDAGLPQNAKQLRLKCYWKLDALQVISIVSNKTTLCRSVALILSICWKQQ